MTFLVLYSNYVVKLQDIIINEMAKEIQRLVKENIKTRYFFAVGAAHLTYCWPTIQDLLEKEGYVIERIPPGGNV